MKLAVVAIAVALGALAACRAPAILNADPVHGGACSNGDQLATLCHDGSCAPNGFHCAPTGGIEQDPLVPLERARDAGAPH